MLTFVEILGNIEKVGESFLFPTKIIYSFHFFFFLAFPSSFFLMHIEGFSPQLHEYSRYNVIFSPEHNSIKIYTFF